MTQIDVAAVTACLYHLSTTVKEATPDSTAISDKKTNFIAYFQRLCQKLELKYMIQCMLSSFYM